MSSSHPRRPRKGAHDSYQEPDPSWNRRVGHRDRTAERVEMQSDTLRRVGESLPRRPLSNSPPSDCPHPPELHSHACIDVDPAFTVGVTFTHFSWEGERDRTGERAKNTQNTVSLTFTSNDEDMRERTEAAFLGFETKLLKRRPDAWEEEGEQGRERMRTNCFERILEEVERTMKRRKAKRNRMTEHASIFQNQRLLMESAGFTAENSASLELVPYLPKEYADVEAPVSCWHGKPDSEGYHTVDSTLFAKAGVADDIDSLGDSVSTHGGALLRARPHTWENDEIDRWTTMNRSRDEIRWSEGQEREMNPRHKRKEAKGKGKSKAALSLQHPANFRFPTKDRQERRRMLNLDLGLSEDDEEAEVQIEQDQETKVDEKLDDDHNLAQADESADESADEAVAPPNPLLRQFAESAAVRQHVAIETTRPRGAHPPTGHPAFAPAHPPEGFAADSSAEEGDSPAVGSDWNSSEEGVRSEDSTEDEGGAEDGDEEEGSLAASGGDEESGEEDSGAESNLEGVSIEGEVNGAEEGEQEDAGVEDDKKGHGGKDRGQMRPAQGKTTDAKGEETDEDASERDSEEDSDDQADNEDDSDESDESDGSDESDEVDESGDSDDGNDSDESDDSDNSDNSDGSDDDNSGEDDEDDESQEDN